MIRTFMMVLLTLTAASCGPRASLHAEKPTTARSAVQAWADAYNSGSMPGLEALIHPRQSLKFRKDKGLIRQQLGVWRIDRYLLGQPVNINNEFSGVTVRLDYHDGRRPKIVEGILVESKGRWWLWAY